ncbi:MAG: isochorismatase family protein [Bradymonadaceae bacterium]|nr:isochorismatase family protein [Lujinxingiaceae bacterium]
MSKIYLSKESALLVIDVQDKLLPAMPEEDRALCLKATNTLLALAHELGTRIVYTEQYPKGLGPTEPGLLEALKSSAAIRVEKMTFDACLAPEFHTQLIELPHQIVVCGMEAHICVLATVRALIERRHQVIVPFDAVVSRRPAYRDNGLEQMRVAGATITNHESLVFDALRSAEHPAFKRFSKMIR